MSHTKTPWNLNASGLINSKNEIVCHIGGILKECDSLFIVKAVNNHDKLVDMVKAFKIYVEAVYPNHELLKLCNEALKQAEE